ncbi:MAG: response regulator [Pseudomonadales bacterium]|nr:response regulator [Pseudomonadales bacterium]
MRLSIEYTGVDEEPSDAYLSDLINLLRSRQVLDPADIVIAVLPPSARFLEEYGNEIYPGVERLYVAAQMRDNDSSFDSSNDLVFSMQSSLEGMVTENLRLIPQIVPGLTDLYVLSGSSAYGGMQERMVRELLVENPVNANVHFVRRAPIGELAPAMEQPGQVSAVMLLSYEFDAGGNNVNTQDALNELVAETEVPVIGIFDSVLGRGIVGGYMSRAVETARRAGEVANAIMLDQPISVNSVPYNYLFDGRQLDRLGIERSLLPAGAIVEYETFTVWQSYRTEILTAFLVIAIQAGLILLLIGSLRKQREVETVLKEQTHDLSIQKNLFESVINSIPDAVLICRVDRTIYAANRSTKEVFDLEPDEIIGVKANELIDYVDEDQRQLEERMLNSNQDSLEPIILKFRKPDGTNFTGETVGTKIISAEGEVLGYFSLVRDVTKRLSREQEERQSQKMEALGTLVGGIAHDFNNVLGVISAYAELLSFDDEIDDGKLNIEKIIKATDRGSDLCNQIMSFSRDMSVEQKPVNFLDVANETIKLLSATIPSRVEIDFKHNADALPLFANSTQLQQVLLNLATNANHAIGDQAGKISISLCEEKVTEKLFLTQGMVSAGKYIVLRVTDNGCGISEENIGRIFEPFYTTKKSEGTGMGMAMVYKIVRAHNGVINLSSTVGAGTEISIYFPRYDLDQTQTAENQNIEVVQGNGERIILVDDEVDLLESVKSILLGIGYDVDAYSDSIEALHCFRKEPGKYELLISDQVMPRLNGTGLMQSMREVRGDLPVILCTGYSEVLDKNHEHDSDVSSVMRKPFTAAEMSHSIERALSD